MIRNISRQPLCRNRISYKPSCKPTCDKNDITEHSATNCPTLAAHFSEQNDKLHGKHSGEVTQNNDSYSMDKIENSSKDTNENSSKSKDTNENLSKSKGAIENASKGTIENASKSTIENSSKDALENSLKSTILKTKFDNLLKTDGEANDTSTLASRRIDPTLVHQVYYFDTLAFVKKLEKSGFSREQAEGCAECMVEVVNTTLDHQGRHMVTKPQQEVSVQQLMSEIVSVKKDMTILQRSEFSTLKSDTEKMGIELQRVQSNLSDQIVKLKGQFTLDINLERGRSLESHAANDRELQKVNNRIDTEIANLKTTYEQNRNDVLKYGGATMIGISTLIVGILRLWY